MFCIFCLIGSLSAMYHHHERIMGKPTRGEREYLRRKEDNRAMYLDVNIIEQNIKTLERERFWDSCGLNTRALASWFGFLVPPMAPGLSDAASDALVMSDMLCRYQLYNLICLSLVPCTVKIQKIQRTIGELKHLQNKLVEKIKINEQRNKSMK